MYYENTYHQGPADLQDTNFQTDAIACETIDAYPEDENAEGHVVAKVFLTKHGDIVISWNDNTERMNPTVHELIQNAIQILKSEQTLQQHPAEKAIRDMLAYAENNRIDMSLFKRDIPIVRLTTLQTYVDTHMHDWYDYQSLNQPNDCIHYPNLTCNYPIHDCKNCPVATGEMPITSCTIK